MPSCRGKFKLFQGIQWINSIEVTLFASLLILSSFSRCIAAAAGHSEADQILSSLHKSWIILPGHFAHCIPHVTRSHLALRLCSPDICRQFERQRRKMSPRLQFVLNAIRDWRLESWDPSVPGECLVTLLPHIYRDPPRLLSSTIARARQTDGRACPGGGDRPVNIAPVRKTAGHCPRCVCPGRENCEARTVRDCEQCHLLTGPDKHPSLTTHRVQVNNFTQAGVVRTDTHLAAHWRHWLPFGTFISSLKWSASRLFICLVCYFYVIAIWILTLKSLKNLH